MTSRALEARALLLITAVLIPSCAPAPRPLEWEARALRQLSVAGRTFPDLSLPALTGETVSLDSTRLRLTGLVLFDEADCLSCVNLAYESWRFQRWIQARGGRVYGIARARNIALVQEYARSARLPFPILVDSTTLTVESLGFVAHPVLLLIAPGGRILSAWVRTSQATELAPIDSLLRAVESVAGSDLPAARSLAARQ